MMLSRGNNDNVGESVIVVDASTPMLANDLASVQVESLRVGDVKSCADGANVDEGKRVV
jgi:hypothetical protein